MEVVRLGPVYSTEYVPDVLIEGYTSMIWTERFYTDGEFELKTPLINKTLNLLPEDTLISHLDTDEVCIVENHVIEMTEDDPPQPELTVTGRSLTSFFEQRFVESTYGKKRKMRRNYTPSAAALVLMWQALDNASGNDVTRGDTDPDTEAILNDYPWTTKDVMANIAITDSVVGTADARRWWLEQGQLLPQLQKILALGDLGMRIIRPGEGSDAKIVKVKYTPLADRGDIVRTLTTNIHALRFDLFDGVDRSISQSARDVVQFSTVQGDLDKMQYLYSKKDFKTIMEVMTSFNVPDVSRTTAEGNYTGLKRRVSSTDAGDPEIPAEPERPDRPDDPKQNATPSEMTAFRDALDQWHDQMQVWRTKHGNWATRRSNIIDEFKEDAAKDALRELKKARRVSLLSGDISPYSPFRYRRDYNLGDRVTLTGNYAPPEDMIVSEYIRTENTTDGDRGYPGLTAP